MKFLFSTFVFLASISAFAGNFEYVIHDSELELSSFNVVAPVVPDLRISQIRLVLSFMIFRRILIKV